MNAKPVVMLIGLVAMASWGWAQSAEDQAALGSFKAVIQHHEDSYKPNGREHVTELGGGWVKERFILVLSSVKFDVQKTNSLVSPYVGTVSFKMIRRLTSFHRTKVEAEHDRLFTQEDLTIHTHHFAYQDSRWQPTTRVYSDTEGPMTEHEYPCDEFMDKADPAERDVHGCLEEFDNK